MWLWFGFGEGVLESRVFSSSKLVGGSGWPHFFAVGGGSEVGRVFFKVVF